MHTYILEVCDYEGLEYKRIIYRTYGVRRDAETAMWDAKRRYPTADCWITCR